MTRLGNLKSNNEPACAYTIINIKRTNKYCNRDVREVFFEI
jgi:hypothetical protein